MTINYDQHFDICTVDDAALMQQMYEAIAKIHVTAKTNVCSTDGYHSVKFTTTEGKSHGLSFENSVLCVGENRYEIDNAEDFWQLFKSTAEACDTQNEPNLGAPFFEFFNDPSIMSFAENFYSDSPDSLTLTYYWYSATEKTVTDAATIKAVYEALNTIVVEAPADTYFTDSDTFITFTYDDGREYSFAFNGENLVLNDGSSPEKVYTLSNGEALWNLINAYQGE